MNRIFCFVQSGMDTDMQYVIAVAEDGTTIAGHLSSNRGFAMHDIGITSEWKHDLYAAHYPDGFELVWADHPVNEPWWPELLSKAKARKAAQDEAEKEGATP